MTLAREPIPHQALNLMRLGERLLHEKLITRDALEEALEAQVVHGGRLGTNLVELGYLKEPDLARMLGAIHTMPFASGELTPDPAALALITPRFADDKDVIAMRADATRLSLAVINPGDIGTLDQLAFNTGRRVIPVVIPEFRMNQLLRRYCKAFRPIRAVDMNVVRPNKKVQEEKRVATQGGELMSEEEFQSLYAAALQGGAAAPVAPSEEEIVQGVVVEESAAPAAQVAPAAPPPAAPSEPPPLDFAAAQAALKQSSDREDVARTVLRFARGKWRRVLLLSVQANLVTGWHGMGVGIRDEAVRRIGIALHGTSTFKLVRDTRSHFIGPVRIDPGTAVLYKLLGGKPPTTAVILPLLVRGKVVHMLYVDNGPGKLTPPDVGELLILSQSVARSYEEMMRRRKGSTSSP